MSSLKDRLLTKIKLNEQTECWECTTAPDGEYGRIRLNGKQHLSHRISWEVHRGAIPDGMFVCHRCDNPSCINPEHLFLGTHLANMADMSHKGRRRGITAVFGERHGRAKITDADVRAIRSSGTSAKALALEYGVSDRQIRHIRSGKSRLARIIGGLHHTRTTGE